MPDSSKQPAQASMQISPTVLTAIVAVLSIPGIGGLIQGSSANSVLENTSKSMQSIERSLMTDIATRKYLEEEAAGIAELKTKVRALKEELTSFRDTTVATTSQLVNATKDRESSIHDRIDRVSARLTKIAEIMIENTVMRPTSPIMKQREIKRIRDRSVIEVSRGR